MCRLITKNLPVENIQKIMRTDPYLTQNVVVPLHGLILTLMADQDFKIACSRAYALSFSEVSQIFSSGLGTSQNSLFGLSIQFLNRYFYVEPLITELNLFPAISSSLKSITVSNFTNFQKSKALINRRYYHTIGDLKVIMNLSNTSRYFWEISSRDILDIFSTYQYCHPQVRRVTTHIEIEANDWMVAFNLFISISSIFEHFVSWFENVDSIKSQPSPITSNQLPTVYEHMYSIVQELLNWQNTFFEQSNWNSYLIPFLDNKSFKICNEFSEKSFHLYLHRYFSNCIKEASRFTHLIESMSQIQSYLYNLIPSDELIILKMVDIPLTTLLFEYQIRAGMWKRNGMVFSSLSFFLCFSFFLSLLIFSMSLFI